MKRLTVLHYWTLLSFGVHIGHSFANSFVYTAWAAYLYLQPHDLVILNLFKSVIQARTGFLAIGAACEHSGPIWFVNLDPINRYYDKFTAEYCGEFNWRGRWVHGALANYATIGPLIYKLMGTPRLWHNARQRWFVGNAKYWMFSRLSWPRVVFTKSVHKSQPPAVESHFLGVPCFGVVDSNAYSHTASIPFPGNDDSISCLIFYHHIVSNFVLFKKMKLAIAWYKNIRLNFNRRERVDTSLLINYNNEISKIDNDLDKLQFADCNAFEEFEFKGPAIIDAWQNFPEINNKEFSIIRWLKEWHIIAGKLSVIKAVYRRNILYSGHSNQKYHLNRYFWGHCWINNYFDKYKSDAYVKNLQFIKRKYKPMRYNYTYGYDTMYYAKFTDNYIAYKYLQYKDIPDIDYYTTNNQYFYVLKSLKYLGMGDYSSNAPKINSILPTFSSSKYTKYLENRFNSNGLNIEILTKSNYLNTFAIRDYNTKIFNKFFKPSSSQSEFIDCGQKEYYNLLNEISKLLHLVSGGSCDYHYNQIYNTYFLIMHTHQLMNKGYFEEADKGHEFPSLTRKLRIEKFYYFIDPTIYLLLSNLRNAYIDLFKNYVFDKKILEKIYPKYRGRQYKYFYPRNIQNVEFKFKLEGFFYKRKLKINLKDFRRKKRFAMKKAIYDKYINSLEYNLSKILLSDFSLGLNIRHYYLKLYNNLFNYRFFLGISRILFRENQKYNIKSFDLNYNILLKNNMLAIYYRNLINNNKSSYLLITPKMQNIGLVVDDLYYFFTNYFKYSQTNISIQPYIETKRWLFSTDGVRNYVLRFDEYTTPHIFYRKINKKWIPKNIYIISKLRFRYFNLFPFVKAFLRKLYLNGINLKMQIKISKDSVGKKVIRRRKYYFIEGLKYWKSTEWSRISTKQAKSQVPQMRAQAIFINKRTIMDRKDSRPYRYREFIKWCRKNPKLYRLIKKNIEDEKAANNPTI